MTTEETRHEPIDADSSGARSLVPRVLGPVLGLALFVVALLVMHHQLRGVHYRDVVLKISAIPGAHLGLALLLSAIGYAALTAYDTLAAYYLGRPMHLKRTALASFTSYAFANNVGFAMVSGGTVRFRLYSAWGFTAAGIGRIVGFCSVTFWLGFALLSGLALVISPHALAERVHAHELVVRAVAVLLLALVASYVTWSAIGRAPKLMQRLGLPLPSPGIALTQLVLSSCDWLAAAGTLFVLLPSDGRPDFAPFLAMFLVAQVLGVVSQVPGGVGVFEGVVLVLSPDADVPRVLAALLAYRVAYYLLPLGIATALLAAHEISRAPRWLDAALRSLGDWVPRVVPNVLAATTFLGGVVLLVSGATPADFGRLRWLADLLPLPVLELSHFTGSVAGACLLVLARGIQRRLDAAWVATVTLLSGGVVLCLLKGLDWEEALILTTMLLALLPCRRHFHRRASVFTEPFTVAWLGTIALALVGTLWIGFFSFRHAPYSDELWWRFTLHGDAPRFLRGSVGVVAVLLVFAVARLLMPGSRARPQLPTPDEWASVRGRVAASREASAHLALLGDKAFLFGTDRRAFVMYAVAGRSCVAMGDPVGDPAEREELGWAFLEMCDRNAWWPVFYEVRGENLPLYLDLGLSPLKIGEDARVFLPDFKLEGSDWKGQRHVLNKLAKDGCVLEVVPPEGVGAILGDLAQVSDAWLADKRSREKGFSLGRFEPEYLRTLPIAVVRREGRIIAFANLWLSGAKCELSVDLMRHVADAPPSVMEGLFLQLMLWGRDEGYEFFSLGMAPLSGLPGRALASRWSRFGSLVYRHGENFYNFQGLRQFKEKFRPQWRPMYLACPGGLALPRILANVAALVSGGLRGIVIK